MIQAKKLKDVEKVLPNGQRKDIPATRTNVRNLEQRNLTMTAIGQINLKGTRGGRFGNPLPMKRALIATLFNGADNVTKWWNCLMHRSVRPDEIAIAGGGSTGGTWEMLLKLRGASAQNAPVRLERKQAKIAAGGTPPSG